MIITVKQLKQNEQIIAPQTIAKAVLVEQQGKIITLDKVLEQNTIITPDNSGLKVEQREQIILTHSNVITANTNPQRLLIAYDSNGHITTAIPSGKTTISVQNTPVIESDSTNDQDLNFGDDFEIDNKNTINLKFNNI